MKKFYLILAAAIGMTITSCTNNDIVEDNPGTGTATTDAINFGFYIPNMTRAGELTGATAAEKLGFRFVVEGTKGSEQTNSPSTKKTPSGSSWTILINVERQSRALCVMRYAYMGELMNRS